MKQASLAWLGLVGCAVLTAALSCGPGAGRDGQPSAGRPNVVIVTFDTTRADHLGPYGAKHCFTPTLNALAKKAFLFERAFASVSATQPSHTTIMTGLYPHYHGVRDNSHFVLKPEAITLAETLQENGYQTAAFVSAFVLDKHFGLDQGFDVYDDDVRPRSEFQGFQVPERRGDATVDAALAWLDAADPRKPFFIWTHLYDPHAPYDAPESFTRWQGHPYDVEIAFADMQLGRLLDRLDQRDAELGSETILVFASDHGEALEQYGEPTHAYFAYDSTLHVPLIIRLPGGAGAGETSSAVVSLADIMPTVLAFTGLPVPGPTEIHGRDLRPVIEAKGAATDLADRAIALESYEPYYSHGWAALEGIRIGERKYIHSPKPELYDLSADRRETPATNLYQSTPDLAGQMESAYRELFDGSLARPSLASQPETPDADVTEKLRALGYVAAALPEEGTFGSNKDLKDALPYYRRVLTAMSLIGLGENADALRVLAELFEEEPENPRVLWILAEIAATTPWVADEALPTVQKAIATPGLVSPGMMPQLLVNYGRIYFNKNDDVQALRYFTDAQQADPNYAGAFWWKSLATLRLGRLPEALAAMTDAAKLFGPEIAPAQVALGLLQFVNGQPAAGSATWNALLEKGRASAGVWAVAANCPLDPGIAPHVLPVLQPFADDPSLPPFVRAAVGAACSNYFALLGEHERALEVLERVRPLLPADDLGIRLAIGRQQFHLGQTASARKLLEECYAAAPDRVDVVTALAGLMEQAGEIDQAVELFEKLYERREDDFATMNNLAWLLLQQGKDPARALHLIKRALNKKSNDPSTNDTASCIYRARGDRELAVRHALRATKIDPQNAAYQYHLGLAYRSLGKEDSAREAFARAVELAPTPRPSWYDEARRAADGLGS